MALVFLCKPVLWLLVFRLGKNRLWSTCSPQAQVPGAEQTLGMDVPTYAGVQFGPSQSVFVCGSLSLRRPLSPVRASCQSGSRQLSGKPTVQGVPSSQDLGAQLLLPQQR